MEEWANSLDLRLANIDDLPTCIRHNGASVIDLTWTSPNLRHQIKSWQVLSEKETLSDHIYILFYVVLGKISNSKMDNNNIEIYSQEIQLRWIAEKADWDLFTTCTLIHEIINTSGLDGPEEEANKLQYTLTDACNASMPVTRLRRHTSVYWWNSNIAELRSACVKARRQLSRARQKIKNPLNYANPEGLVGRHLDLTESPMEF